MTPARSSRALRTIPILITACFLSLPAHAKYSGGTGEPNDPYQIATADDLMLLGESPEDYDKHFILTADIDLDPNLPGRKVFDKAVIAPVSELDILPWMEGASFTGVFDGNGYTISHLIIEGQNYLGLFGRSDSRAEIFDLSLEAVDIRGSRNWGTYLVGGLVGINEGSIAICNSNGTVTGNDRVGGLVGRNSGNIIASYCTCTCTGSQSVGGLVGYNGSGNIIASYCTGTVSGNHYVGGLVGQNGGGIISSYSTGTVGGNENVGGLVGYDGEGFGITTASFWDTEASGQSSSAGGIGLTTAEMQDTSTFLNARWDLVDETSNGTSDYWQIAHGNYPSLFHSSAANPVMPEGLGTAQQPYLIRDVRDLGTMWFQPTASYRLEASVDLSGITWTVAVVPWFGGSFDGNGHVISNLHIEGSRFLGLFGELDPGAKISNLGLEAVDVNGMGEYVEGLEMHPMGYVGGLAGLNSEGVITNSHCTGIVSGTFPVGGLVGWNSEGVVANSYGSGTVNGISYVGGLVGFNSGGMITGSSSTGTIRGGSNVGGLVGENNDSGSITDSYSTTTVSGDYAVGGLVGRNSFKGTCTITNCYSTGKVTGNSRVSGLVGLGSSSNDVINCFWDMETSGQTRSEGGKGKTTPEMQTASTFLEAGWDFVDETANGTDDIWWILEGQDYPRLWWEAHGN